MNFIAQKNKKLNDARLQAAQTQQQAMTLVQQTQQQVSSLIFISCVTTKLPLSSLHYQTRSGMTTPNL